MILVLGSSADKVYPWLVSQLRARDHPFVVVDEEYPERYEVQCDEANGRPRFRITGDHCRGENPVGSIFVRHAVARTLSPGHLYRMGLLQTNLNRMLLFTSCPIVNPPANAYSNYSKPFQVGLLAEAGFEVPRTLVTNLPDEARRFYAECERQVIYKGVSNVMTLAQVLTPDQFERLAFLPNSPTLFQEFVAGVDYRVHVVDGEAFVTRLVARNEDYRRSLLVTDEEVAVEPAHLPAPVIDRCLAFTRQLGLIVSGIDFKETVDGRLVALELNPYPQFTFYERRSGQAITNAVVEYLIGHQAAETDLFA
jgi:glutathione synthase/RimK-type ligase-like ATP-grasp enzyme